MKKLEAAYQWLLTDLDRDGYPDVPAGRIYLENDFSQDVALSALNMVARLAYESSGFVPGVLSFDEPVGTGNVILRTDDTLTPGQGMVRFVDGNLLLSAPKGGLLSLSRYAFSRLPYVWQVGAGCERLEDAKCPVDAILVDYAAGCIDTLYCDGEVAQNVAFTAVKNFCENGTVRKNPNFVMPEVSAESEKVALSHKPDLTDLFSAAGIYEDTVGDLMNNSCPFVVQVPSGLNCAQLALCADFVSRCALDSLQISFDFAVAQAPEGMETVVFSLGEETSVSDAAGQLTVSVGNADDAKAFGTYLAQQYPMMDSRKTLPMKEMLRHLRKAVSAQCAQGQLAAALLAGENETVYLEDDGEIASRIGSTEIRCRKEDDVIFAMEEDLPWEVDDFLAMGQRAIAQCKPGDKVEIVGFLSEPLEIREDVCRRLAKAGEEQQIAVECKVYNAFKPGLSWVRETFIPQAVGCCGKAVSAKLHFKPAPYEGIEDWATYTGEIPAFKTEDTNWKEVPINLLTDIYPFDDFISDAFAMDRDRVTFHPACQKDDYVLELLDEQGSAIYSASFNIPTRERLFLQEFADLGTVCIPCSRICVCCNGEEILCEDIHTDVERAWDFYTDTVLPAARDYILGRDGGEVKRENQPFFKELVYKVTASEPDEKLIYRTDRVSSLEALHEDVYFVGLDYFKYQGERTSGESTDEPGLISPVLKAKSGGGAQVSARLVSEKYARPVRISGGETIRITAPGGDVTVEKIGSSGGHPYIQCRVSTQEAFALLERYAQLVSDGFCGGMMAQLSCDVRVCAPDGSVAVFPANPAELEKPVAFDGKMIETEDGIIGYDQYVTMMEQIRAVPGTLIYPASNSYQGRPVYAFENIDYRKIPMVSLAKRINRRPTVLITNRHHANEVSSTTAAFMLLRDMLSGQRNTEFMDKLNLAIVPFENVDGGALHYELQKDNPEWMLHSARFNAAGIDFGREYMNEETRHTEALAMTRLFKRWLPDVMADNHGIPHHECVYPMIGYLKPVWKGNWLPRAIWYGILYYQTDEGREINNQATDSVRNCTAEVINADAEFKALNAEWRDRYQKYGYHFMPELFEAQFYDDIIYYHNEVGSGPDVPKARFIAQQNPDICAMGWITEVADETAQGEYLQLCARAHYTATVATLKLLSNTPVTLDNRDCDGNRVSLCSKRSRPMQIVYP